MGLLTLSPHAPHHLSVPSRSLTSLRGEPGARGFPEDEAGGEASQPFCSLGAFSRVWPHPPNTSAPPSPLDNHKSPHCPKGLSHPFPPLPPARGESLESAGAFSPSSPLWTGRQAQGPSGWQAGLERTSPQLHMVCSGEGPFSTGDPTPAPGPWRAAGLMGKGW